MRENGFQILEDTRKTAFNVAFRSALNRSFLALAPADNRESLLVADLSLYDYYHEVDIRRGQRFARAMAGHYDSPLDPPIEAMYPFGELPPGSLLVDIGGGSGQHAKRLLKKYPRISVVVQDHASVVSTAQKTTLDPEIANRLRWEPHDYYTEQPRKGAAIYLFSHVMMDNTDA
jgi:hypothetical protein